MSHIMGIDLGTSSVKAIIMSDRGAIKAVCSRDYPIDVPADGFAEQSPESWWNACVEAIRHCIGKSGIEPEEIKCVGFSGQMHGTVVLDREQQPIRPAILHCDQRSTEQVQYIKQLLGEEYIKNTLLNPVFPGFQLVTLCWIREMEPHHFERISSVLLPKDFIRLQLTGEIATDYSDASGTLAFDIRKREWCLETIEKLGIPPHIFPKCLAPSAIAGQITKAASRLTGLAAGTLVAAGGSDQVMQSIGNGVIRPGSATVTIGTSGQVLIPTQSPVLNEKLNTHTFCGASEDSWYVLGAILNAGVCLNWFKNNVYRHAGETFGELDHEIINMRPGSGGILFLPYLTGERTPHMDSHARGMLFGLTLQHDYRHIAKAIMEGVSFAMKECLDACAGLGLAPDILVASGGGARSRVWVQLLSDVFNKEVYTTNIREHASVGAAIVAGAGCGIYTDIEEGCKSVVRLLESPVKPIRENVEVYSDYFALYKEIYQTNASLFKQITKLNKAYPIQSAY